MIIFCVLIFYLCSLHSLHPPRTPLRVPIRPSEVCIHMYYGSAAPVAGARMKCQTEVNYYCVTYISLSGAPVKFHAAQMSRRLIWFRCSSHPFSLILNAV